MKKLIALFVVIIFTFSSKAQIVKDTARSLSIVVSDKGTSSCITCPMDTIKGMLYYLPRIEEGNSCGGTVDIGYYIGLCGGWGLGRYFTETGDGMDSTIGDHILVTPYILCQDEKNNVHQQRNSNGYFADRHFKRIPTYRIYGLWVNCNDEKPNYNPDKKYQSILDSLK